MEDATDPLLPIAPAVLPLTGGDTKLPPLVIPVSVEVRGDAHDIEVRVLED